MNKFTVHIILTVIAALFLFIGLNLVPLFDWDELNFAEASREMVLTKNYLYTQVGFEPFWEKPPLFIWLQSIGLQLFGNHTWVYKLPNVLAGIVTVNFTYHIGSTVGKRMLGVFWALTSLFTFIPFIYWKSGMIDPVFNLFIMLSLFQWYKITQASLNEERSHIYYLLSGLFLGLAVLTKGPVALLIFGLVVSVICIFRSRWYDIFSGKLILFLIGLSAVILFWIIPLINANGSAFFSNFIAYHIELFKGQIPEHNQPWFYHVIVLLLLCFPSSILSIPHLVGNRIIDRNVDMWHLFMRSIFWVVLIIFSITTTKIIHYSSLCWWPLTYFGAYQIYLIYTQRDTIPYWLNIPLFLVGIVFMAALWLIPLIAIIRPIPNYLLMHVDVFTRDILISMPKWGWTTLIPGCLFLFWFIPWIISSFFGKKPNLIYLYIMTGLVAITGSLTILPAATNSIQGPVTSLIKLAKKKGVFIETWGYKTYALYFHGELNPSDFNGMIPENPIPDDYPYPKQEKRRLHAHNPNIHKQMFVITKSNFKPDESFMHKFHEHRKLSGYILWLRN